MGAVIYLNGRGVAYARVRGYADVAGAVRAADRRVARFVGHSYRVVGAVDRWLVDDRHCPDCGGYIVGLRHRRADCDGAS